MAMDLSSYGSVGSAMFVKVTVYDDVGVDEVWTYSDYHKTLTIDGTNYTGLGQLMNLTESQTDLRLSGFELTMSISGIPSANISDFLNKKIKGSSVQVLRGIFDVNTGTLLSITGNPAGRFYGIVTNYAINEDYPEFGKDATNTISMICNSNVGMFGSKLAGRYTNPASEKKYYPNDLSMDRVPNISNSNFNFGAPV